MAYLVDGHNLIPHVPGIALEDIDDEVQLVEVLQEFSRRAHKQVQVYFDNASPASPRLLSLGTVKVQFIRAGSSADRAIEQKLARLGRSARSWTVVSSDRQVQAAARAAHAQVLSSSDFAAFIRQTLESPGAEPEEQPASQADLEEWLKLFGIDDEE